MGRGTTGCDSKEQDRKHEVDRRLDRQGSNGWADDVQDSLVGPGLQLTTLLSRIVFPPCRNVKDIIRQIFVYWMSIETPQVKRSIKAILNIPGQNET